MKGVKIMIDRADKHIGALFCEIHNYESEKFKNMLNEVTETFLEVLEKREDIKFLAMMDVEELDQTIPMKILFMHKTNIETVEAKTVEAKTVEAKANNVELILMQLPTKESIPLTLANAQILLRHEQTFSFEATVCGEREGAFITRNYTEMYDDIDLYIPPHSITTQDRQTVSKATIVTAQRYHQPNKTSLMIIHKPGDEDNIMMPHRQLSQFLATLQTAVDAIAQTESID